VPGGRAVDSPDLPLFTLSSRVPMSRLRLQSGSRTLDGIGETGTWRSSWPGHGIASSDSAEIRDDVGVLSPSPYPSPVKGEGMHGYSLLGERVRVRGAQDHRSFEQLLDTSVRSFAAAAYRPYVDAPILLVNPVDNA